MALSVVQRKNTDNSGSGTSLSLAFTSTTSAGNLLIVPVSNQLANNVASITDTAGNSYVKGGSEFTASGNQNSLSIWYAKNALANAGTVQLNLTSSAAFRVIAIYEVAGADTSAPFDTTNSTKTGSAASGTSVASATFTISGSEIIIGIIEADGASLVGTNGYTLNATPSGFFADLYHITSANEAATATCGNNKWEIAADAFKVAGGGSTNRPGTLPMMGCGIIRSGDHHAANDNRYSRRESGLWVPKRELLRAA